MIAAIYARRSNEQNVADEAKSVTRQVEHARAFAAARGWTVPDEHVYVDDGISGAEFERRPGFMRLKAALRPRAPFSVLVVSEQKSIGRETFETNYTIKQLAEAGVEVWGYMEGRSLTPKNWMDKAMSAMRSAADEAHREDTSRRVHESHADKVRRGYVVGGRVFGYRNVDVFAGVDQHGRPLRSHVERTIDDAEAAIVRRIFELYAAGLGLKAIAKRLTGEGAAEPKPFRRRDGLTPPGWAPSTVRTILARDIYRGQITWTRSRKRTAWGKVDQRARPASEWVSVAAEHLRIVHEDLWTRVATRRKDTEGKAVRFADGRISGRPPKHATQNLLAGFATCATCGGGLVVETSGRKRGRVAEYVCSRHRHNGTCANALRIAATDMNEAVLAAIEAHALTPEAVEHVIQLTEQDDVRDRQDALGRERREVERRIARLVEVIEGGGDAASIVAKVRELEARRKAIDDELECLRPVPRLAPQVVDDRLEEWRRLLRQSTTQARAVLQRVLDGRITFTPRADGTGYDFTAPTRFDKLFAGIAIERPEWVKPGDARGAETIGAEDTLDGDYGRVLERASMRLREKAKKSAPPEVSPTASDGKGLASPTGVEPVFQP